MYDLRLMSSPSYSRSLGRVIPRVLLLGPPVLCTAAAAHDLLYNRSGPLDWLLAMAVVWPLLARRRAPVAVFWCCWGVAMVTWALGTVSFAEFAVLVALYTVAAHRDPRHAVAAAVAVGLGVGVTAVRFGPTGSVNDVAIVLGGLTAAALFLGTTVRAQHRYLASIEDRAERLEREREQQARLAAAAERTRIAREMHDIVAHGLVVVVALAEAAAATNATDPPGARDKMLQAAATGRESLTGMRRLLGVLRTEGGADRAPQPDLGSLKTLVDETRRTGLDVRLTESGGWDALGPEVQTTVYRLVQESLTNAVKHARGATRVDVVLRYDRRTVAFRISDDGAPEAPARSGGNGLTGMRERVAMFDGTLRAGPAEPGPGWTVAGELRLGERESAALTPEEAR
ncbi:integral membrane sensor signal transduction histidine kinase [Actinobacteria bacterium OK074]|nr:integral membrane sensor signal transduction histidine kinase [Actinobacteria bacterium OK074]